MLPFLAKQNIPEKEKERFLNKVEKYFQKCYLKMGQPRPLFCLFSSFQTNITNFTTNMNVKKCPSSIRRWDSNSQPSDYESPPLTTRPGLPPIALKLLRWVELS